MRADGVAAASIVADGAVMDRATVSSSVVTALRWGARGLGERCAYVVPDCFAAVWVEGLADQGTALCVVAARRDLPYEAATG